MLLSPEQFAKLVEYASCKALNIVSSVLNPNYSDSNHKLLDMLVGKYFFKN